MSKYYQKLTPRLLEHTLTWGDIACKKDGWNKSDANVYFLIQEEVKRLRHERYEKRRKAEVNPYIDPDQPYPTT